MYQPIQNLLSILAKTEKKYDIDKICRAYAFAAKLHEGQFRVSGDPYISHPIAVAEIVAGLELDTDSICAALLHDTVEDCDISLDTIKENFGSETAFLVDGLTKLAKIPFADKQEQQVENLRKMFLAMSKDIRVIFIKLCDRLHNMRTLGVKEEGKRRVTALETMQVFAPLAHRLGMQKIKHELENLSLSFLDPIGYNEIYRDIERRYGQNIGFIEKAKKQISDKLEEMNFRFVMEGRVKTVYSVYKKMYEQNKNFDEIYDFYALRVITETELDCYTILGIIHDMFKSIPGRFKDYISTPKPNLYRSLHTTVIGRDGIPFEVQIRTREMHHVAEYGIAAHWKYKTGESSKADIDSKLEWISKLIESEDYTKDPDEFLRSLKIDIFHDETFVFTPKGDVVVLPQGSTLIDFAYAIHSAVGNKMVGAKVNGAIAPIDSVPENGQIIEVLTSSSSKGPSRDWLKIVKTAEARNKIRQWFKKEKRPENIAVGKNEVDKELRRYGRAYTEAQRQEILYNIGSRMGIQTVDDLYNMIGYGGLSVAKISIKLHDEFERVVKPDVQPAPLELEDIKVKPRTGHSGSGVIIDGQDGCAVKFAKCCNPLPGDKIIGFVTKGYGVSVHKRECPNVTSILDDPAYDGRFMTAHWDEETMNSIAARQTYEAYIQIRAENSLKLLADITAALADMRVALHSINTQNKPDNLIVINLVVGCKNIEHYHSIVARLKSVPNVEDVVRGYT
ncbi:MAG: bifunctional (p)ppGpp synthetase/guanosine-3',5'-bis(diphosphate) 3'-pyrophosphohydrolase [Ruminococcaceae bacterium]|nr:bifunctional (p)ppGpp synthetase/guanosine-3',5'-bis(diphosphate) 3'-pyrophosphohydrolase [Oscillospiraceae bacterium]